MARHQIDVTDEGYVPRTRGHVSVARATDGDKIVFEVRAVAAGDANATHLQAPAHALAEERATVMSERGAFEEGKRYLYRVDLVGDPVLGTRLGIEDL